MNAEAVQEAVRSVEAKFLEVVRSNWLVKPLYASCGTCVLMGFLAHNTLHVASLGDSKAVLGRKRGLLRGGGMTAIELSVEHNVNNPAEREALKRQHPTEKDVLVDRGGVWRVKGIIQVGPCNPGLWFQGPWPDSCGLKGLTSR